MKVRAPASSVWRPPNFLPMQPPPDPLEPLLERARAAAPRLEVSLVSEVWRRIRATRTAAARPGWLARLETVFERPSFAVAFMAACVLFGLFLAEMRLSRLQADHNAQLARSYLRLIDPLLENPPPPGNPAAPRP
jgi:hypothetical protein